MRYAGFVGPSATPRSRIACDDRTVNLFIEKNETGTGAAPYTLYLVPGYRQWCDLGTSSPVRGQFTLNGLDYAVSAGTLFQVPSVRGAAATTLVSGITNPDDSPVSIIGNGEGGFQLAIAAAGSLYSFNVQTNALTFIPAIAATQLVFINGTAIALDPNSSTLYASDPEDFSTWDPLSVAQRNAAADKIQAIKRVNAEMWAFGSQTTSVYYDAGNTDFPLSPNPSVFIQRGILAPWSCAVADGSPIWLGTGLDGAGTIYRANGYMPQAISTSAVEYQLSTYSTLLDAEAWVYQSTGHLFYVITFPTADHTWMYDVSEGLWTEIGEWNGLDYGQIPIRGQAYCFNTNLVGSRTSGLILEQTFNVSTETDGATNLRWNRRAPHLVDELRRMTYGHLRLHAEVGVGLPGGTDADTEVSLRYSDDGGQTFGDVVTSSLGAMGEYGTLVDWWMLGQGRDRVFDMFGAGPVITALIDCYVYPRPGAS